ncbi:hypothetical protein BT69DRAFT_1277363, partial [Atractiella rhizophila]
MASIKSLPIELLTHIIRLLLLDLQQRLPDDSEGSSFPSSLQVEVLSIATSLTPCLQKCTGQFSNLVLFLAAILFILLIPTSFTCLLPLQSGSTAMLVAHNLYIC